MSKKRVLPPKQEDLDTKPVKSSFRITSGGIVDENPWTREDKVLARLKCPTVFARAALRAMAKQGKIPYRRHPEHGYWEYGPTWSDKNFVIEGLPA